MRNESWDSSQPVTEVSGRLDIDGKEVIATDLSASRSIPSNLPDQVAGVGGYSAATGSATVLPLESSSEKSPTPWGSSTPRPLSSVNAYAVSGKNSVPVFSGVLDSTKGKASESDTSVKLVDISDRLNRAVSVPPLCRLMPPPTTDGSTTPMHIGLVGSYYVDRVLRDCGFYATPPIGGRCVLSVPLTGSTYPERGRITRSGREGGWRDQPYFSNAWHSPLGYRLYAEYEPQLDGYHAEGDLSRPMEIVLSAGNTQEDSCRIECVWGNGAAIAVGLTSSKSVMVQFTYPTDTSTRGTVFTATTSEIGNWRHISVRFDPNGDKSTAITVRTNYGRSKRLGRATLPWGTEHTPMKNVTVDLRGNVVGGLQVLFPAAPSGLEQYEPTANITGPPEMASLWGGPAIINEPAIDLLTKWSKAECAATWIDEFGVFQWRNRVSFTSGAVVTEVDSANSLLDLTWSHDVQGASRRAVVGYKEVAIQRSNTSRMEVWEGSGQTMAPGDIMEDFVSPPTDEVWIKVDGTPKVFQAETSKQEFNTAYGSWVGYTAYDSKGNESTLGDRVGYGSIVEFIDSQTWKITQTWDGYVPSGVDHIKLQTRDGGTALKPQWQGQNLPLLRAQMRLKMNQVSLMSVAKGPVEAPDLTHNADWWIQTSDQARSLANWLAQQTIKPRPIVDGIEIMPDPRLQLGDKIHVHDTHRTGLRITGVITEIDQDISAGDYSMSLKLLVTAVMADKPTLSDYDSVFSGAELSSRDEKWDGKTLAQFDSNPLDR